ncbi:MAG TPA: hypothetical protein VFL38_15735 [Humibacillus xanthopallidus]|nr:hypothetical protein [Humibacillus xanthopallidus]
MSSESTNPSERRGVARRTVAKGMAWSVPAVAVAAAAPVLAASGAPPTPAVGTACKLPGNSAQSCANVFAGLPGLDPNKAFAIPLLITNNTNKAIVLKPSVTITSSGLPFNVVGIIPTYCTPIAPGASVKVIVYANSDNSANQSVTLGFTIPWGHDCNDVDHPPIVINGIVISAFPPCSSNTPFPQGAPTCDPPFYQQPA